MQKTNNQSFFSYNSIGDYMFNIRHFISDTSFQMIYINNYLDLINYKDIISMDSNKIILELVNRKLMITGNNLTVKKLLESEMVIDGKIITIEFINE